MPLCHRVSTAGAMRSGERLGTKASAQKKKPRHEAGAETVFRCHGRRLLREEQQGAEARGQCSLAFHMRL